MNNHIKRVTQILSIAILILAIPITVLVAQQQQQTRQNASTSSGLVFAQTSTGATFTYSNDVSVSGNVTANGFCIGTNCLTSWPSGGGSIAGKNMILVSGTNPTCPSDHPNAFMKNWVAKTYSGPLGAWEQGTTAAGWGGAVNPPFVHLASTWGESVYTADSWTDVMCMN